MTRREKRIQKIRARINTLDKLIEKQFKKLGDVHVSAATEKLQDRRDMWEERLVQAEPS